MSLNDRPKREGYLLVDHRASPGLPPEVARAAGYLPELCGEGKMFEAATLTCTHCKVVVVKNPLRTRERASCARCDGRYLCDACGVLAAATGYTHLPYEQLADQVLNLAEQQGSPRALLEEPPTVIKEPHHGT